MAAFAKTSIFYISVGFWLILGVECYGGWSNHMLTVQTGGSVTIPCHYDKKYTQQKKYWYSEIDKSKTYTNTTEENLSVIDHPDQSLFTVTMRNLQNKHNGTYYCTVETGEQPSTTVTYEPHLNIQSVPDVSVVNSSVSGHEGGDISVQCLYSSGYQNKVKQWCRYKDQSCYTVGRTDTSQNPSVQISDDGRRSFTVLMTGLRLTDSGWYWCSVGDSLNPVHLTVTEAEPGTVKVTNNKLLTVWLPVSAVLLLLLILVGVFTWRWRQRPKQDKPQIRERNGSTTDIIYSKPEDPVIYSTINDENPNDPSKDITTYSTIDHVPGSEANPPAGGTIYSTVAPH
ncbi:polymeric immunoglobulin receptor isoform X2 [Labeo rohita]|uniref:polymeric immunoglobulin receptor isoform X2 n=1 Tax=Labeo rohita TaxID=84645 RepID=UPI0021E2C21C|nr:polymeric immunoglobulin receptor isoform X2 [Labeo rohita]